MTIEEMEDHAKDVVARDTLPGLPLDERPTMEAAGLARFVLLVMPALRAGLQWSADEELHTIDSNCAAGDHDDCPSRVSEPIAREAFDRLRAALEGK